MRMTLPSGTPAEIARPSGTPDMGLVVIPDIWGLRPLFDDLCARIAAEQNMVVCAVEPFPGQNLGTAPEDQPARARALAAKRDEEMMRDVSEAADATGCDHVGLIGFCMGGMYALKAAGLGRFDRIVSFYGMIRVPEEWRQPGDAEPLDILAKPGGSRVMAIIGERDHFTPPADVAALEFAGVSVARYPEAGHGFVHDPARPAHRPEDAADAWARCWAFLRGGLTSA